MRNLIAVAVLVMSVSLVACVSDHEALRNDKGQVVNCSNEGWGWLGAPVAMANQSDCIKKAEAAGFHRPGIADAASPQKVSTSAPATSSPSSNASVTPPAHGATAPTPAAPPVSTTPPSNGSPTSSTADRLRKLDDLYKAGLISKDEYDRKRQEILSTL